MPDLKISQFTNGGPVQTTDEIATNRAGVNKKVFVGSAAAHDATDFAQIDNNLSDLTNEATARDNLGLGTIAVQDAESVAITGGTITGMPLPGTADAVATREYVDYMAFRVVSADTTLTDADYGVIVDTGAGDINITLPLTAAVWDDTNHRGKMFNIVKPDAANIINLLATGPSDKILGVSSLAVAGVANVTLGAYNPTNLWAVL